MSETNETQRHEFIPDPAGTPRCLFALPCPDDVTGCEVLHCCGQPLKAKVHEVHAAAIKLIEAKRDEWQQEIAKAESKRRHKIQVATANELIALLKSLTLHK